MITKHYRGPGEHSVSELEAIADMQQEVLHLKQIRLQDLEAELENIKAELERALYHLDSRKAAEF